MIHVDIFNQALPRSPPFFGVLVAYKILTSGMKSKDKRVVHVLK